MTTASQLADTVREQLFAFPYPDRGQQKNALAALAALVALAEGAESAAWETAERDWEQYVHEVEDEKARADGLLRRAEEAERNLGVVKGSLNDAVANYAERQKDAMRYASEARAAESRAAKLEAAVFAVRCEINWAIGYVGTIPEDEWSVGLAEGLGRAAALLVSAGRDEGPS